MVFTRGIKGDLKLQPQVKLLTGLALISAAIGWTLFDQISQMRAQMAVCDANGGVWHGGVPVRVGMIQDLHGRCEINERQFDQ